MTSSADASSNLPPALKEELWGLVRDAQRYRELRKHRPQGVPQKGIPFAMGWQIDDDEKFTYETIYIREGELDYTVDQVLEGQNIFPGDEYDRLLNGLK